MDLAPFMLKNGFRQVLSDLLKSTRMITTWLIIMEILVFIAEVVAGNGFDTLTSNPFLGPTDTGRYYTGGSCSSCIADGNQYFRVFTPLLLHSNIAQLLINVFAQRSILTRIEHNWRVMAVVFYVAGGCMSTMVANAFTSSAHLATATSGTTGMLAYYICILVYRAEPDMAIGPKLVQSSLLYLAVLILLSAMMGGSALICVISMMHGVVAATLMAKIGTQSRLVHVVKALGYVLFLVAYFTVGYVCIAVLAATPAQPALSSSTL
jgi:membrane associated rhomboid family serine protease